jgi:amylosucrase
MMDWARAASRHEGDTASSQCFLGTRQILARRRALPELHGAVPTVILDAPAPGVFAFARRAPARTILCLFNFSEGWTHVPAGWLRAQGSTRLYDELSEAHVAMHDGNIALPPQGRVWLV